MTHFHLATRCNELVRYNRSRSYLRVVACAQPVVTFKPPKKGEIKILLDILKYTKEKKSQCSIYQAYEVLHEYI